MPSIMDKEYIVISLISSSKIRSWEINKWNEVLDYLIENFNYTVILVGSKNQYAYLNNLSTGRERIMNLAGALEILESFVLVKFCRLFIGIDSAISHVAKYYNVPRILVLGGGPYGLMFAKNSFYQQNKTEKILFHPMDCFGCNWHCIYDKPYCLTNLKISSLVKTISSVLGSITD
jgi:heptosyltransferase-3